MQVHSYMSKGRPLWLWWYGACPACMGFWVQSSVFPKQRLHYSVKPTFLIISTYHLLNSIWKLRNEGKVETHIRSCDSPASHERYSDQLWISITWELWQDPAPEQVNQNLTKGK